LLTSGFVGLDLRNFNLKPMRAEKNSDSPAPEEDSAKVSEVPEIDGAPVNVSLVGRPMHGTDAFR